MSVPLPLEEVERIAALAFLELTDEEKHLFARQLADMLALAQQIQPLDTTGVPATAHVHAGLRLERDDEGRPCLTVEDAVANAPDPARALDGGFFRVPRVIAG
jgi:aspartyl-tRNA(Asn)/glutamyl-tRNA(Gln) amidotransferase subunit C